MEHELKTDSGVFCATLEGLKTFEIRKNDRNFTTGDTLLLRETKYTGEDMKVGGAPLIYTSRKIRVNVIYILRGPCYGLDDGWVIMTVEPRDGC